MSGVSQDWIFVAIFFGAFIAVTIGEIMWLSKLQVPMKKVLTAVFIPNFATITLGFFVTFIIFGLILAATGNDGEAVASTGTTVTFLAALSFPVMLMAVVRRLLIVGLRIEQVERPTRYAIFSTFVFFAVVFGLPMLLITAIR